MLFVRVLAKTLETGGGSLPHSCVVCLCSVMLLQLSATKHVQRDLLLTSTLHLGCTGQHYT